MFDCPLFYSSVCPFVCLSVFQFVCLYVWPFVRLSGRLSVCPFVHLSVCPFVRLIVCWAIIWLNCRPFVSSYLTLELKHGEGFKQKFNRRRFVNLKFGIYFFSVELTDFWLFYHNKNSYIKIWVIFYHYNVIIESCDLAFWEILDQAENNWNILTLWFKMCPTYQHDVSRKNGTSVLLKVVRAHGNIL